MVDGIIFTHAADNEETCTGLNKSKIPVILIDRDYRNENVKNESVHIMFESSEKEYISPLLCLNAKLS